MFFPIVSCIIAGILCFHSDIRATSIDGSRYFSAHEGNSDVIIAEISPIFEPYSFFIKLPEREKTAPLFLNKSLSG